MKHLMTDVAALFGIALVVGGLFVLDPQVGGFSAVVAGVTVLTASVMVARRGR